MSLLSCKLSSKLHKENHEQDTLQNGEVKLHNWCSLEYCAPKYSKETFDTHVKFIIHSRVMQ